MITCIVCGKELEPVVDDDFFYGEMRVDASVPNTQPHDGVVFTATGNYGSTVYDPCKPGHTLVAIVCDSCVIKHRARIFEVTPQNVAEER